MDQQVKEQLENSINNNDVCLFMKGSPEAPQCGFSMAVSNILKIMEVKYQSVDVLKDQNIREGIKFNKFKDLINIYQYFFSEDQGRYIIEVDKNNLKKVENILKKNSVHFDLLGEITEKEIIINDEPTFTVDKVTEFYKGWLYKYMS